MGEEGEREYDCEQGKVVDTEVGEVLADTSGGIGKRFRPGEGGPVDEFSPRTSVRERMADGSRKTCEEGTQRCGDGGLLRLGGGGGGLLA